MGVVENRERNAGVPSREVFKRVNCLWWLSVSARTRDRATFSTPINSEYSASSPADPSTAPTTFAGEVHAFMTYLVSVTSCGT